MAKDFPPAEQQKYSFFLFHNEAKPICVVERWRKRASERAREKERRWCGCEVDRRVVKYTFSIFERIWIFMLSLYNICKIISRKTFVLVEERTENSLNRGDFRRGGDGVVWGVSMEIYCMFSSELCERPGLHRSRPYKHFFFIVNAEIKHSLSFHRNSSLSHSFPCFLLPSSIHPPTTVAALLAFAYAYNFVCVCVEMGDGHM
jgi:hypothetical protein